MIGVTVGQRFGGSIVLVLVVVLGPFFRYSDAR